jgi:hypothetical protein
MIVMNTKWFEVTVTAIKTIAVEIDEDCPRDLKEEAEHEATMHAFSFCDDVEGQAVELKTDAEIQSSKQHATEVMSL